MFNVKLSGVIVTPRLLSVFTTYLCVCRNVLFHGSCRDD